MYAIIIIIICRSIIFDFGLLRDWVSFNSFVCR